jgi:hypothetical protein
MKRSPLAIVIVVALVLIGVVFYLGTSRPSENETAPIRVTPGPAEGVSEPANASSNVVSCAGPINSQVPLPALDARHKWAHSLLQTNHVNSALTEFRNIATLDPGYPAINLEISQALLKANRASEAQDAIKLQIEISDCLANLPERDTQNYCKSQWVLEPQAGCTPELLKINREAHYEAGLVDADIARGVASRTAAVAAVTPQPRQVIAPRPTPAPATAVASPPKQVAAVTPPADIPTPTPAAPNPAPALPVNIKTAEAMDYVGKLAKVCGTVVSKHTAEESNGKPTFLNLDRGFPKQAFTIVVWGAEASAVGDLPETGDVCVTGTIATYRGVPQIVLHDAQSWSVASSVVP